MSAGLRDQRIRIYDYSAVDSGGYQSSSYAYVAERWGRLEAPGGREATVAAQANQQIDAVVSFAADAPVTANGILKVVSTAKVYRVTAVLPRRMLNELEVYAVHNDDASLTLAGDPP